MRLIILLLFVSITTHAQTRMKGKGVFIDSTTGKFYTVAVPDTGVALALPPAPLKAKRKKK